MRPKSIGILGGAGPLAGAYLLERVVSLASSEYNCVKDADFPEIVTLSYPFSDMLSPAIDACQIQNELSRCLKRLEANGAHVLAIACNTLHAFLKEEFLSLIQLPEVIAREVQNQVPLVLCTSTSMKCALHRKYFACKFPTSLMQEKIDEIIESILAGGNLSNIAKKLVKILEEEASRSIVLGCTELSLLTRYLPKSDLIFIDPIELISKRILELSFKVSK